MDVTIFNLILILREFYFIILNYMSRYMKKKKKKCNKYIVFNYLNCINIVLIYNFPSLKIKNKN